MPRILGFVRRSRIIGWLAPLLLAGAAIAEAPQRVVSINLCTDQLALDLAAPGQLMSVSRLAHDPAANAQYEQARALHANGSTAEEVYLMAPDLVLAGTFTAPSTVNLLESLGIRVELFAPARSLADVPNLMQQMGAALGRDDAAAAAIARYRTELAALTHKPSRRPRAALSYVNSYSSGDKTLAGDILRAAGFENVAVEAGLSSVGVLPLERLILLAPEVIITGRNYPGHARAEDNLVHPALRALQGSYFAGELTDRDWICGTPRVLNAVRAMASLRDMVLKQ